MIATRVLLLVLLALVSGASAFAPARAGMYTAGARSSAVSMKFSSVKTGVTVKVIAGDDKGKVGKVLSVDRSDTKKKTKTNFGPFVVVEGMNMITKHIKPRARGETGKRIQKEARIHISNVVAVVSDAAPIAASE
ncbi:chloroplast 50S ribosomal protein L24 [Pavlovales sp. CCMP2436]|nr:chloroplast 50S ribosomal protein L24 [Pavlovales sp. CCMP2436]